MSCNSASEEPCMTKKKRSLPGHPDPDSEVIALSPRSLLATNRFVCEICHKGFQRDQNLQLHRRGHNLPWRLKQIQASNEVARKKVYVCPEPTCAHHEPARALGDLTGIKKHFSRKHGEKKWKCDKCSKRYAVQSDWKAHQKTCGTREYRCDCGTMFSRRDSFITHRAFCDALAEENVRVSSHTPHGGHDNSQQSAATSLADHISSFVNGGEMASAMRATSSPSSQLSRDVLSTYSDMSNPSMAPSQASELGSQWEGSMAGSLYPKGIQAHAPRISTQSPALSLCLGMEPEPGPQGALQNLMANSTMSTASIGATGMLSTFSSSPEKSFARVDGASTNNGMGNTSGYAGLLNTEPDQPRPHSPPFMFSTSRNANKPLNNTPLSHPSSPSLSATALLQKAAQMGSTASKPFWLQKLGVGAGEATQLEVQNPVKWSGVSTMFSSSIQGKEAADRKARETDGTKNLHACTEPGYGSMQELLKPTSGRSSSLADAWSDMPMPSSGTHIHSTAANKPAGWQGARSKATAMVDFLGIEGSARSNAGAHQPN